MKKKKLIKSEIVELLAHKNLSAKQLISVYRYIYDLKTKKK